MKDRFWFEHDSNAHTDPKITHLRMRYGLAAYGAFWVIIEKLRDSGDYTIDMALLDAICFDLRIEREWVDTMFELGLLERNEKFFWSGTLTKRMSKWEEKKARRAAAGRKGGNARAMLQQCQSNATAMPEQKDSKTKAVLKQNSGNAVARTEQNRTEQESTGVTDPSLRSGSPEQFASSQEVLSLPSSPVPSSIPIDNTRGKARPSKEAKSSATWEAYVEAYERRYHTSPIRNAKSNALCCTLVDHLGANDAPHVAAYYLSSNYRWYVQRGHALDALVADAQKLHTEWATGRRVTATAAQEGDRLQHAGDGWARIMEEKGT